MDIRASGVIELLVGLEYDTDATFQGHSADLFLKKKKSTGNWETKRQPPDVP